MITPTRHPQPPALQALDALTHPELIAKAKSLGLPSHYTRKALMTIIGNHLRDQQTAKGRRQQ